MAYNHLAQNQITVDSIEPTETENGIGLTKEQKLKSCEFLSNVLADQHILYMKLRNYHWNVTGPHFNGYHSLFEEQYDILEEAIDTTAERIRFLGYKTPGTLVEMLKNATLQEDEPLQKLSAKDMITNLLNDNEACVRSLRKFIEQTAYDAGTNDYFIKIIQDHEKMAWKLRMLLMPKD